MGKGRDKRRRNKKKQEKSKSFKEKHGSGISSDIGNKINTYVTHETTYSEDRTHKEEWEN